VPVDESVTDDEMLVDSFVGAMTECETSENRIPEPCGAHSADPPADVTSADLAYVHTPLELHGAVSPLALMGP
jgi:hypothetical protein